jgi:indole-3-glycerol phosphate synthase
MLDKILAHKRTEIEHLNLAELKARAADAPTPRPFLPPSAPPRVRLIAELKRASPSRGLLAPHLNLIELAQIYADNGASAISILTDEKFFLGQLDTLHALRFTSHVSLPLLRKDFILAEAQLYETRAAGADAVLLIAAALPSVETPRWGVSAGPERSSDEQRRSTGTSLQELHALALELGLTPLVEVHDEAELECVLRLPNLKLVGINNRDLKTFNISLDTTMRLRPLIPPGLAVVSESGIFTAAHVAQLAALPVNAILVGEALVTAPDIGAKVRELSGGLGD